MTDPVDCPGCGQPRSADAPHGLCPACLLREGLETVEQDPGEVATLATPPAAGVDLRAPAAALLARELQGRYTHAQEAARGGMGRVMLVRDGQLGREVALKELLPDAPSQATDLSHPLAARFAREARITAQLQHPAITPVYELGRRDDGSLYYTMKFVRGKTLSQAIAAARTLEGRLRLLPHFVDLCQAIAYAHSRGVLHRDIKPSNVIVGEFGETVVVDWGLAKLRGQAGEAMGDAPLLGGSTPDDGQKTAHGHALGTPSYMPPEQALGLLDELDERSDVYSLGAVLYEILTGRNPYSGPSAAAVVSSVIAGPPLAPRDLDRNVPVEYAAICSRAMARDPASRPASALLLATEIENVKIRPRKSSARQVLERLALGAALAIPLLVLLANWQSRKALESALGRMSAKGIDVRFARPEDFLTPTPAVLSPSAAQPPAQASAVGALYALSWRFPDLADKESHLWQSLRSLESDVVVGAEAPAPADARRIEEFLRSNQSVLLALHEMARLPPGDARGVFKQAASSSRSPFDWPIPDFVAIQGAARLLSLEARLADLEGHQAEALEGLGRILELSSQYGRLPWLISGLRRLILANLALDGFEAMQDHLAPGEDPRAFETALADLSPRTELLRGLEGELKSILAAFDLLKSRSARDDASAFTDSPLSFANLGWTLYGSRPLRFWIISDEILYLGFMTDYVEAIRRPYSEGRAELLRIDTESERAMGRLHPVTSMVLARLSRHAARAAVVESRVTRARLRLALHRYRARLGRYPETLDALRPFELAEVPRDAVSGQPVEYRLTGTGYFLSAAPSLEALP